MVSPLPAKRKQIRWKPFLFFTLPRAHRCLGRIVCLRRPGFLGPWALPSGTEDQLCKPQRCRHRDGAELSWSRRAAVEVSRLGR